VGFVGDAENVMAGASSSSAASDAASGDITMGTMNALLECGLAGVKAPINTGTLCTTALPQTM
jgi:hypothetical protein